ncbi:putative protein for very long chain fatty acid elongation [Halotydeus destructor]|nr:putative protein for very long chain fatty acid elongation [Halotydeus destructor]
MLVSVAATMSPSHSLFYHYDQLLARGDDRVKGHLLMSSPWPAVAIVVIYVLFVKYVGPKLMANRRPFELRNVLLLYNLAMVVYNSVMWYHGGIYGWFGKYNVNCQPVDYSRSADGLGMANTAHAYFMSKIIELLDTVFFVLRKKDSQVTFLHVWHHSFMVISMWWGVKFAPGGHGSFIGFVNSFVHIIMYTYYFLSALGPEVAPYLRWKKYLTTIQMIQFACFFVHAMQLTIIECNYPKFLVYCTLVNSVVFMAMFAQFYMTSYRKRKSDTDGQVVAKQTISQSWSSKTARRFANAINKHGG